MSTEGNDRKNEMARTAAFAFADALASVYRAQLSERLIGAYLIGSIAHGGFSHRYSDIDLALVTEDGLDAGVKIRIALPAVEQRDGVAAAERGVDDGAPEEPGAAQDEDAHGPHRVSHA